MAGDNKSNASSGAEAMVRLLALHGVKHVFGLCGDTSLPFYDALQRLNHGMTHILTRDERSAAYMADAYARVSGRAGVCECPSGGGATYILPGLVEASESSYSVLGITTDISTRSRGRYALTELDQQSLFRPLTKWNGSIEHADRLPAMVRAAFRAMTTGRPGAAHLAFPFDVQKDAVPEEEIWADPQFGRYPALPSAPDPAAVTAAVDELLAAKRPIVVCGGGVVIAGGEGELQSLAESLDIPVATTVSGQGSLAENHPNCLGVVGSNGGVPATRRLVEEADLVFFVGCRAGSVTTERWRHPKPGTKILHLDSDPQVIGANYPTAVALAGDARLGLAAVCRELATRGAATVSFGGGDRVMAARREKEDAFAALAASDELPIRPERLIATMQDLLPEDAVIVADPGTPCPYLSAHYEQRRPGRHFISNRAHGALGYSLAAAVGAHYGRPGAKVVAMMGDGSFGFTSGELETVVRLGLPITMIVVSNACYGWIKAGQKSGFGGRYFSVDFSRTDHAGVAAAYGVKSWQVEDPARLKRALAAALDHGGPSLLDVICQPLQEAAAPVSEWVA
ncbi:MAG TPA: thiamine pyrophosphate-binding protein [Kiloniellaceae bacterium]|nr:thiamine pyrophosphate-binding protein [Kiloniellaceae bacterium]